MKNVMFADVPVGGKFLYHGFDYLKVKNYQNGKLSAVNLNTGEHYTECIHWNVVLLNEQPSKKAPSPVKNKVQVLLTYDYNEEPALFTMTDEQFYLFRILYDNNFLGDDANYTIMDSDINNYDATKR